MALSDGGLALPEAGRIAVFAPRAGAELAPLPAGLCHVLTRFRPDHDHFSALGHACAVEPEGRYSAAVVCLPRARTLARDLIATACDVTDGPVIVDGAKTAGVEAALKECRARTEVSGPVSKAHGKMFWFTPAPGQFDDWRCGGPAPLGDGFVTAPGVFSADGIDPGSKLLGDTFPRKIGARVADLGAGWGYLAARILERDTVETVHAVEADHAALSCARRNLPDPRVRFHWEDATRWRPPEALDTVIANPPFHTGRDADPALGRAFITAAAAMLAPGGQLWLVANRHLPYEAPLADNFEESVEVAGDSRFKVLHARRPSRHRR